MSIFSKKKQKPKETGNTFFVKPTEQQVSEMDQVPLKNKMEEFLKQPLEESEKYTEPIMDQPPTSEEEDDKLYGDEVEEFEEAIEEEFKKPMKPKIEPKEEVVNEEYVTIDDFEFMKTELEEYLTKMVHLVTNLQERVNNLEAFAYRIKQS